MIVHEDEHVLVVNKPPGWNTHAPSPHTGEGVYDWLRHREPRWASLAIIHRLDKETSGLLVFGKTDLANRSLTEQFSQRRVTKEYRLATQERVAFGQLTVRSGLRRQGDRYVVTPIRGGSSLAETRFRQPGIGLKPRSRGARGERPGAEERAATVFQPTKRVGGAIELLAVPVTGKTHQIRVHAAARGFPILGDSLYGGAPAGRLCLHAERLGFRHPASGEPIGFWAPARFDADRAELLREAITDPDLTDVCRWLHGAGEVADLLPRREDGPGFYVDRLGDYLLAQGAGRPSVNQEALLRRFLARHGLRGAYAKELRLGVRGQRPGRVSPFRVLGESAPEAFTVRENGVRFEIRFGEGYSVGLFLDQRDNRRRLLVNHVAAGWPVFPDGLRNAEVLNVFAYTCAFSVCAAKAGAQTTSVDLSPKYLEWGRRNFLLNDFDPAAHEFLCGDAFEWLRRLAKKQRCFDAVLLDPPTFSTSKQSGVFRAESDYGRLVTAALPVLKPGGLLFCSSNAAHWGPAAFLAVIQSAVTRSGRTIARQHYAPQPPDFPVSRDQPAYLKTVWLGGVDARS